ncbi:MAG: putative Ig domain-containing protein [Acidobacteriota bacterium]
MKRLLSAAAIVLTAAVNLHAQSVRHAPEFEQHSIPANDDGSSGLESLGFTVNLFGKIRTAVYVNNNGNLTFDGPLATFTPFGLKGTAREIIAPFFADVDTRGAGTKLVTYGQGTINGHRAFVANYVDVGYYATHTDKTNSFQVALVDRSDIGFGDFDIEFNYDRISWETGDASSGVGGLGGVSATVGWSNGADTSFELPGSMIPGSFLDNGPYSLVRQSITGAVGTGANTPAGKAGRLVFRTRDGVISPGVVISGGQLPDATLGVPYSTTLTLKGATPPYKWAIQPDVVTPPGLAFSTAGVLSGTPTSAGTYGFTVGVTAQSEDGEITVYERASLTVRPATLRITSSCPVQDAYVGQPYSLQLAASGASGLTWSIRNRAELPAGLGLSASGLLAGTPQQPGSVVMALEVKGPDGSVPTQTLCRLNVNPAAIQLSGCSLPHATVGVPFSQLLQTSGGLAPYRFELLGDLPQGMVLNREGAILGTPNMWGVWLFKIATTDAGASRNVQDCALIVDPARFSTSVCPLPGGVTGAPYSTTLAGGFTWSAIGKLPGGLTLTPDGKISGTPMAAGGSQFTLLATNGEGQQTTEACSIVVTRGTLSFAGCPLPDARAGVPYTTLLEGLGGNGPYLFSTVAGSLPAGFSLLSSGTINGTATTAGNYSFTLRVRDNDGALAMQACQVQVRPAELRLSSACPLPDGRVGETYSQKVAAEGGQSPYQFSFGFLPEGLTGAIDGTISGKPARLGGGGFPIRVVDAAGTRSETMCSIAVTAPGVPAISLADPPATVAPATTNLSVTVKLASAYTAPVQGQIMMAVTPDTAGSDPVVDSSDPLLAFASGQRTASFTIPVGATSVAVPVVSTGTVASTAVLSLTKLEASGAPILQSPAPKVFRILPSAPSLSSICYVRTNTEQGVQLDFRMSGISTTRELTRAVLTIPGLQMVHSNIPVPAEFVFDTANTVTVDLNGAAFGYYASPVNVRTGGAFSLVIPVSLEGTPAVLSPAAKLDGLTVAIFNKQGGSATRTVAACQ